MKLLPMIAAAALMGLSATAAHAAQIYDYSYTFNTGDVITGTFTGTLNQSTGLVSIGPTATASFDGVSLGTFSTLSYTAVGQQNCGNCYTSGGAVVSLTNPLQDNFLFSKNGAYFYVVPWTNGPQTEATQFFSDPSVTGVTVASHDFGGTEPNYINYYNGQFVPGNLTVSAVPIPGALPLFGSALVGIGALARRRRGKKAA